MFTGIDIGGTNTDIALIDDDIRTIKVPNSKGLEHALQMAGAGGRLAVSTSQPLNAMVTGTAGRIRTITIPGPGLVYGGAVKGAVGPRGDVLEPVDTEEIENLLRGCRADGIAIAGKFSVRNPVQEEIVRDIARLFFDDEQIAISSPLGGLILLMGKPRATTAKSNSSGLCAKNWVTLWSMVPPGADRGGAVGDDPPRRGHPLDARLSISQDSGLKPCLWASIAIPPWPRGRRGRIVIHVQRSLDSRPQV